MAFSQSSTDRRCHWRYKQCSDWILIVAFMEEATGEVGVGGDGE